MRLSCPNCGAQYEVPAEVIPENGRDVQCSNCGHTWFQLHPDHDSEMSLELGTPTLDEGWTPEAPASPDSPTPPEDVDHPAIDEDEVQPPEIDFGDEDEDTDADTPDDDDDAIASAVQSMVGQDDETAADAAETGEEDTAVPSEQDLRDRLEPAPQSRYEPRTPEDENDRFPVSPPPRPRREIDPGVIDVLREEAEHEARLRAHESDGDLETQPDLGLDAPLSAPTTDPRASETQARTRRMRGLPEEPEMSEEADLIEAVHQVTRRDLLPDIEEINSTLRSTDERSPEDHPVLAMGARRKRRIGFRLGFGFTMLAASFVILAYVYNKEIIVAWPAGEPQVNSFVDTVNTARLWLDTRVTEAMLWLDGKAASVGGNVSGDISQ